MSVYKVIDIIGTQHAVLGGCRRLSGREGTRNPA